MWMESRGRELIAFGVGAVSVGLVWLATRLVSDRSRISNRPTSSALATSRERTVGEEPAGSDPAIEANAELASRVAELNRKVRELEAQKKLLETQKSELEERVRAAAGSGTDGGNKETYDLS